ncbi:unnamed protein product [Coccothraustes coccothraustes]
MVPAAAAPSGRGFPRELPAPGEPLLPPGARTTAYLRFPSPRAPPVALWDFVFRRIVRCHDGMPTLKRGHGHRCGVKAATRSCEVELNP